MLIQQNVLGSILVAVGQKLIDTEEELFITDIFEEDEALIDLATKVREQTGLDEPVVDRLLAWAENEITALDSLMVDPDIEGKNDDDYDDDVEGTDDDDDGDGGDDDDDDIDLLGGGGADLDLDEDSLTDEDATERALIRGERSSDDF